MTAMRHRNPKTGAWCCCPRCKNLPVPSDAAPAPAPVVATAHEEPPDPPSLSAALGGKVVDYPPTYIFGRPQSRPLVTATGVPEPPSLIDACKAQKEKR